MGKDDARVMGSLLYVSSRRWRIGSAMVFNGLRISKNSMDQDRLFLSSTWIVVISVSHPPALRTPFLPP